MYEVALAFSLITFIVIATLFWRNLSFSVFHPLTFYIAFHGMVFVIRPIVAWYSSFEYVYIVYKFNPSFDNKITALLASNVGFISFSLFCLYVGQAKMNFKIDKATGIERKQLLKLLPLVLMICVPIGAYSLITALGNSFSGVAAESMALDAGTGTFINTSQNGYLIEAQLMLATCGALLAWLFRFRFWSLIPLLLFVVIRAGTGGRWPFVVALSAVGLFYLYDRKLRFSGLRLTLAVAAIAFVFAAVGADRGSSIRNLLSSDTKTIYQSTYDYKFMEGMDLANLEYFEYLVYAIPQRTHIYGYFIDTLQVFTEPVPRVLWEEKPVGAPFNRIFLFDFGFPIGMTRSLPGQGWYSLGWLGVIIWCSLWGAALGWIYRKYVESQQSTLQTSAYLVFLASLIAVFRDGTLLTLFRYGSFLLFPIAVWYGLARLTKLQTISQIRGLLVRSAQAQGAGLAAPSSGLERLPAAVQRRRAALTSGGAQQP